MSEQPKISKRPGPPILIVDDEEIVLVALRDTLLHEGYNVVSSPHAVHALSVLEEQRFSVVITDHQMPMVTGLEFLALVRQIQPDATRILITAVLNISTLIDAINKAEIHRFVVKPWSREELLASVKTAVERFEQISNNARLQAETAAKNQELTRVVSALEEEVARLKAENEKLSGGGAERE
jgi:response regulator RpfG family c-di-GMP phosphodiesterase